MANPRPLSIVKVSTQALNDLRAESFGLTEKDRFIYFGEISQDSTRCVVQTLNTQRIIPYLFTDMFEEVDPGDF